eukprot:COSAG04_NODE_22316_length_357_cov_0.600775_1_plen_88_part_10
MLTTQTDSDLVSREQQLEAAETAKAILAAEQLAQVTGVSIEGHPTPAYNDVYRRRDSTHEGWPVLKSDKGRYCYRYTPVDQWRLSDKF